MVLPIGIHQNWTWTLQSSGYNNLIFIKIFKNTLFYNIYKLSCFLFRNLHNFRLLRKLDFYVVTKFEFSVHRFSGWILGGFVYRTKNQYLNSVEYRLFQYVKGTPSSTQSVHLYICKYLNIYPLMLTHGTHKEWKKIFSRDTHPTQIYCNFTAEFVDQAKEKNSSPTATFKSASYH